MFPYVSLLRCLVIHIKITSRFTYRIVFSSYSRIPDRGNRAELVLTCLHKGSVVDDFLGQVTLPLNEMDVYERPRQRWYRLESKPGQEKKDKQRGELEVRIAFTVNPETGGNVGSTLDLSRKEKGSRLGLGGSLLSLGDGDKRQRMKNFAKSLGSKMHISGKPKKESNGGANGNGAAGGVGTAGAGAGNAGQYADGDSITSSGLSVNRAHHNQQQPASRQAKTAVGQLGSFGRKQPNIDPGVHSDEEEEDDFVFDNISHKSSGSSLNALRSSAQLLAGGQAAVTLPPPSPLSTHSSGGQTIGNSVAAIVSNTPDDVKLRSQTLPPPSKPPRVTPEPPTVEAPAVGSAAVPSVVASSPAVPKVDEWEAKLYGRQHLDIGSSADSLKRRSWESSRVIPISVTPPSASTQQQHAGNQQLQQQPAGASSTAPTTPNLEDQKRVVEQIEKPRPLPRSATLESIEERERSAIALDGESNKQLDKTDKVEKRFLHKLKYFQRKDRSESAEDLKAMVGNGGSRKHQPQQQFNERIIIGHENDLTRRSGNGNGAESAVHVPLALQKKYDGKTREVIKQFFLKVHLFKIYVYFSKCQEMILLANDLENEVKSQKLKMKEMEDYLDDLLLRVMETHPKILQNPYRNQLSAKR